MSGDDAGDADGPAGEFEAHLRAGVAVHNAGFHHAAHDAWEAEWLDRRDEPVADLLQGLIQFTAAVHHARDRNRAGATGLAASAREYLDGAPDRGVNVADVREYLARLEADPELVEREPVLALTHEGDRVDLSDLEFPEAAVAAPLVAEALDHDEDLLADAVAYAEADVESGRPTSPFVTLVMDYVAGGDRGIVLQRLGEHVERRRGKERDVEGLFEE